LVIQWQPTGWLPNLPKNALEFAGHPGARGSPESGLDFCHRKIEEQEKYLPDLHDAAAARAVLDD
jgi:hypothetical protein